MIPSLFIVSFALSASFLLIYKFLSFFSGDDERTTLKKKEIGRLKKIIMKMT